MTDDFAGRVAIVTGAARGLGRAAAARLLERRASVAVNVRDAPRAEAVARSLGERALAVAGDLTGEGVIASVVRRTLERFGRLLDEGWRVRCGLPGVSTPEVDTAYERALATGALGGTLLGPGGGGFLLLFVPPAYHARVKTMLRPLTHVPFEFERAGTEIIFADPEIEPETEDLASDYADHLSGRRLPQGF